MGWATRHRARCRVAHCPPGAHRIHSAAAHEPMDQSAAYGVWTFLGPLCVSSRVLFGVAWHAPYEAGAAGALGVGPRGGPRAPPPRLNTPPHTPPAPCGALA